MKIPKITHKQLIALDPNTFEVTQSEINFCKQIQDPLFAILNTEHPESQLLDSDYIIIYIILILRENPTDFFSAESLVQAILHINSPLSIENTQSLS